MALLVYVHICVHIHIYISEVIPLIPLLAVLVQLNIYRRSNNFDLKQSFSVLPLNTCEACFWEKGSSWTLLLEYTNNNIIGAINKKIGQICIFGLLEWGGFVYVLQLLHVQSIEKLMSKGLHFLCQYR